jgi:PAS domain S-box-containing protein
MRVKKDSARTIHSMVRQAEAVKLEREFQKDQSQKEPSPAVYSYNDWFDSAPICFYTLDCQGRICQTNERGAKLLGFDSKWLMGRAFVVFVAKQDVRKFLDFLTNSARHPQTAMIEVDLFVGNRTPSVQIWVTTMDSQPVVHQLSVVDLTDLKKTEELLQESLSNWYSLVHNAPDTILTVEQSGRVVFINKPLWGFSASAILNTNLLNLLPETERNKVQRSVERTFRYNRRDICEITGVNGDQERWYQFSFGTPHAVDSNGLTTTATTTTLIIREISEDKRAEASLRTSGEQLRDFAARLEAVREEERTRVAREIHDELGQALTALKMDLSWLKAKSHTQAATRKKLKECIKQVDDTIESVRRISSELRPSVLDNLGLIPAIEWQVSQFQTRTGTPVSYVSNVEDLNLSMEASVAVFRVVQEAFTNIMRHAQATKVNVSLIADTDEGEVRISIADNGIGMPLSPQKQLRSLGIVGMRERISRIGGEFQCSSVIGRGTRLEINIPLDK